MRQISHVKALLGIGSAAVTGLLAASVALADPGDGRYNDHYGMMGGGGWFFGPIMLLIFFGLLVGAVVLIVRLLGADQFRSPGQTGDKALSLLRERFARGEISQEEFETAKKALE